MKDGSGSPWMGAATLYAVATDASNSYAIGDVVVSATSCDPDGVPQVTKYYTTTQVPLGIVVGIRIADPGVSLVGNSFALEHSYIPAGAAGPNGFHYLYVVDSPDIIFEVSLGADAGNTGNITSFHKNTGLTVTQNQTTLSNSSQYSSVSTNDTYTTTAALASPIRLLGAVVDPTNAVSATGNGAYTRVLGRWNYHEFLGAATGI
jgi:hypothetical protein